MRTEMTQRPIIRPATAHGWLKRSEAGTGTCHVWEAPCGRLVLVVAGQVPTIRAVPVRAGGGA